MEKFITNPKKGKTFNIQFNGTMDMFNYISKNPFDNTCVSKRPREEDFCSYTWKQTKDHLINGWPEGDKVIEMKVKDIEAAFQVDLPTLEVQYDVIGDYIDIGRYMEGVPEAFGQFEMVDNKKTEINVLVNTTASWQVSEDTIYNRGACIINLLDLLQQRYHSVNLQFIWHCENSGFKLDAQDAKYLSIILDIDLKNTFSKDAIVFILANTGYIRRCCFSVYEILGNKPDMMGYGRVCEYAEYNKDNTIYFPHLSTADNTHLPYIDIQSAKEEIERIINDIDQKGE